MKNPKNFLVYCGNAGLGKTYLCAALIEWAMKNFNSFRYWKEEHLHQRLRETFDAEKGDYVQALKFFLDDDLIFLDDIASSGITDWRREILFQTVDLRYNSMKPTVFTSNFSKTEFYENYHERIGSRLFSHDNIIIEILDGPDFRKKQ